MRLEQLKSLTDDELTMLWFAVNKLSPPVSPLFEMEPSVFCAIKSRAVINRIDQLKSLVKQEHMPIYESLRQKLDMAPVSGSITTQ